MGFFDLGLRKRSWRLVCATGVLTYVLGALKLKTLLTRTKHLQVANPSRARHERFTQLAFRLRMD